MIEKNFSEVNESDIQALVTDEVPESRTLDYKLILPGEGESEKREFLADISAFANSGGGDILFGLGERRDQNNKNTGLPELVGLPEGVNPDSEVLRLQNILSSGIKPKIPGAQIKFIKMTAGKQVCLLRVPKSWAAPHMVVFKTPPAFYARTSAGKQPLDIHEIRNSFLGSDSFRQRIQDFRLSRLGRIMGGEFPCAIKGRSFTVLHLVPLESLVSEVAVDLKAVCEGRYKVHPIYGTAGGWRYNLDGVLFTHSSRDGGCGSYLQVYRDGRIESVESHFTAKRPEHGRILPFVAFEEAILRAVTGYLHFYKETELSGPFVLMLSLVNIRGLYIATNQWEGNPQNQAVQESNLVLPDILVENFEEPVDAILRPALDMIWNACGYERCLSYDDKGQWRNLSR